MSVPVSEPPVLLSRYLLLFALTYFLEWPFYRSPVKTLVLNLATHPAVIFLFPYLFLGHETRFMVLWAELFAIGLEFAILWRYYRYLLFRSLKLAVAANLFSWWLGTYAVRFL